MRSRWERFSRNSEKRAQKIDELVLEGKRLAKGKLTPKQLYGQFESFFGNQYEGQRILIEHLAAGKNSGDAGDAHSLKNLLGKKGENAKQAEEARQKLNAQGGNAGRQEDNQPNEPVRAKV